MNDDVNEYDGLRRALRDALPTGAGFPSPRLLDRILRRLSPRARPAGRWRERLPAVAALMISLALGEIVVVPRYQGRADVGVQFRSHGRVEFLSSAAQPSAEYRDMIRYVLAGFDGKVDFNSQPTAAQDIERVTFEHGVGQSTIDLVALTTSDMVKLKDQDGLEDLTPLMRRLQRNRQFPPAVVAYGKFGTDKQYFIPWLQATYLMAVNQKALPYLPAHADINHLTYEELIAWGQNIKAATGESRIGLPADLSGPRGGLVYRFLQGYTYPSYTGSTLTGFRSPEAVQMWQMLRRLWSVTNQWSTHYTRMDEPLATGEVWIAWDHQARLKETLADPQFIAIPAPAGPRGQGYLSVVLGLAIPKDAPNRAGAEALIDWLTLPRQQTAASTSLNYFPVVQGVGLTEPQLTEYQVAKRYQSSEDGIETLLPSGLGSSADAFTAVYQDTFARIVVRSEDIHTVLDVEAPRLQALVDNAGASCWPPDPPSGGPCQIK